MTEGALLIVELLTYIEEVEKLKSKPAFTVPTDFFSAHQHDLKGLPEVRFNIQIEGDDVWLRIPRLQEIPAPSLGDNLREWVTLAKTPEKAPELKSECVIFEGKIEVSRELLSERPDIQKLYNWYVENQWEPWAAAERPRRKTISVYNKLFSLQQTIASEGSETPLELVWGIGFAAWKKEGYATAVKYPMLIQGCELTLNERTFDLEIRPRESDPQLDVDCYAEMDIAGVKQLEAFWKSFQSNSESRINPFESSTFEGVLKAAVGYLDPTGNYEVRNDDVTPPSASEKLKVTNTWVLFARKRGGDIFLEDIRKLKKTVEEAQQIPAVIRSFVEHGDNTVRAHPEVVFRGLSTSDGSSGGMELYFPMPYNDEQVSIIQKLELNDGVVVQGPPGTGKTHTIANVICHYLAQGKRVLVTSKGETALSVLQEKLPERIRSLCVALLSEEREGMKQFEHAIQTIASEVEGINPQRLASSIARLQQQLDQLHANISNTDRSISNHAAMHMCSYKFHGKEISSEELAKQVLEQADEHEWFDDEPPEIANDGISIQEDDISSLRKARIAVGADLQYLKHSLPPTDDLPSWTDLAVLHRDLLRARKIEANLSQGTLIPLLDSSHETFEIARNLLTFLDEYVGLKSKLAKNPIGTTLINKFSNVKQDDHLFKSLLAACDIFRDLEHRRKNLITKAISLPDLAEQNDDYIEATTRLIAGKRPFALPFGNKEARQLIASTLVLGETPRNPEMWNEVYSYVNWRLDAHREIARWTSIANEFGLVTSQAKVESAVGQIIESQKWVEEAKKFIFIMQSQLNKRIEAAFGKQIVDRLLADQDAFIEEARNSLNAHLDHGRLAYAMQRINDTLKKIQERDGPIVTEIRKFLVERLGTDDLDEADLQTNWLELELELTRLNNLTPAFATIERVSQLIEDQGSPKWAHRLRTTIATNNSDEMLPIRWRDAWIWKVAYLFLERIDAHSKIRDLFAQRHALTASLSRTYQDIVADKTWLGVFNNSPQSIRQALQAYLAAIRSMGAGTGIRAIRHRRNAREAMKHAYMAVPCWVLPQWRVSETIPPELGLFDLVIIDEASQSDIWALPALLRGKKLLVVGDDKQVSPTIFTAERKIVELEQRFLRAQPHGAQMTPDKSVYDLARVVFAGNSVMLKEHFRCVPAIIEFSNREFYNGDIKPLRVPKSNERLDPPLIDVFVKGGHRRGDVNQPEAKAIIDEIEIILRDPNLFGRSIGVVTLLGNEQAKRLHELISERISPADVIERKLAVGPPAVFQGRERDIMMVSMVLAPGDRGTSNVAGQLQRFNVALSRARDRMYLFRSVEQNAYGDDTLSGKVLRHFRKPFTQDVRNIENLRTLCESGFELEMFNELTKRGFRVQPQVPCGSYRIDFVVEGSEGKRLAIECDGDRFHGPGQWSEDMIRQRVLERAGWTFWRCFASSFARRREAVIDDLLGTLTKLGIEPLGADSMDNTVWVETREVDPYGIDNQTIQEGQMA